MRNKSKPFRSGIDFKIQLNAFSQNKGEHIKVLSVNQMKLLTEISDLSPLSTTTLVSSGPQQSQISCYQTFCFCVSSLQYITINSQHCWLEPSPGSQEISVSDAPASHLEVWLVVNCGHIVTIPGITNRWTRGSGLPLYLKLIVKYVRSGVRWL